MRARATSLPKGAVLFVENDATLQASVAATLRAERYEVFLAANRRQAVALRDRVAINVLVLDMDVQAKDSWRLLADFAGNTPRARILVLARSLEQLAWASGAGADAFLLKPLEVSRLVTGINRLLAQAQTGIPAEDWPLRSTAPFVKAPASGRHWRINE